MAVGDRQKLITEIVATVLGESPPCGFKFDWLTNKHSEQHFQQFYPAIETIFASLNGELFANKKKRLEYLKCDAYFPEHNFIFEFDEYQHFSSARLKALYTYPSAICVGFNLSQYKEWATVYKFCADKYRYKKKAVDFPFEGGRTAQRAYLDSFKDLLPPLHGLAPTIRISEFEVNSILANDEQSQLLMKHLIHSKLNDRSSL